MKTPALFLGHGSPMNAIEPNNPFNQGFAEVAQSFAKPVAVLCISAHWYEPSLQIQSGENPPLIYDFYGFPDELYRVEYPVSGSPKLTKRVGGLLGGELIFNDSRGYDHGAWAVLKHLYPDADVPVVQLSLDSTQSADWHWQTAQKLRPLRDEGVLILGSGDIVHNLRAVDWWHISTIGAGYDWAYEFRDAVNEAIERQDQATLTDIARLGQPAHLSVPTPEHYLPLLYVLAVRDEGEPVSLFNDVLLGGSLSMTSVKVGN